MLLLSLLVLVSTPALAAAAIANKCVEGHQHCYKEGVTGSYVGNISVTRTGRTCQRWDTQSPVDHDYVAKDFTGDGYFPENYCRVMKSESPWCYTTDPAVRWERCDVSLCSVCGDQHCYRAGVKGSYVGSVNVTETGRRCQRWDSKTPHNHTFTLDAFLGDETYPDNHCRVLDELRPWCYSTDADKRWQFCDVPLCGKQHCYEKGARASYVGTVSVTESGFPCQRWDVQSPHYHNYTTEDFLGDETYPANHCRVLDRSSPWCFTNNTDKLWDYCHVPLCG